MCLVRRGGIVVGLSGGLLEAGVVVFVGRHTEGTKSILVESWESRSSYHVLGPAAGNGIRHSTPCREVLCCLFTPDPGAYLQSGDTAQTKICSRKTAAQASRSAHHCIKTLRSQIAKSFTRKLHGLCLSSAGSEDPGFGGVHQTDWLREKPAVVSHRLAVSAAPPHYGVLD